MNIHQHGLNRSLVIHFRKRFPDARVDLKFDGYTFPKERPLILFERMLNEFTILSKQREGVGTTYRFQVGLFANNSVELSILEEELSRAFLFDEIEYYETMTDGEPFVCGKFKCLVTDVTPIYSDDITDKSEYHRVYFDIEIESLLRKRRG